MRFLVIGAGGVGGYFGGRLAQAGEDVVFAARGRHLEALRGGGLRLHSPRGDWAGPVRAVGHPAEVAELWAGQPADAVLFAVKSYDTESAARDWRQALGAASAVVCLQNGVDNEARLAAALGTAAVLGGVAYIEAFVAEPGRIVHRAAGRLVIGEVDWPAAFAAAPDVPAAAAPPAPAPAAVTPAAAAPPASGPGRSPTAGRAAAIAAAFERAGVECAVSEDIVRAKWEKLTFNAPINAMTALLQVSQGPILRCPESRAAVVAAAREVLAVAEACGAHVDEGVVERMLAFADRHDMVSSMQRDRAAGRRLEAEALNGVVARLATRHGLATPVNATLFALLQAVAGAHRRTM